MFVKANAIPFTQAGLQALNVTDTVQTDSGLGGCVTLTVTKNDNATLRLQGDKNAPSWLQLVDYSYQQALDEIYLLMPVADYGLTDQHFQVAVKAGYREHDELVAIITKTANTFSSVVDKFVKTKLAESAQA